jgi:hypothetical protein
MRPIILAPLLASLASAHAAEPPQPTPHPTLTGPTLTGPTLTGPTLTGPTLTGKERLSDKASDEQRIHDCKVPPSRRTRTRPETCPWYVGS